MPSLYMNGRNYTGSGGGGGNVYGAFIDTNRIIQETITVQGSTPIEYTATEDCCVIYTVTESGSSQSMVYVNNTMIKLDVGKTDVNWLYLKSGDALQIAGNSAKNYTVFGLTFGTQNIFTPQIYSTEEREVGVWVDNKPLYAKSYDFGALPNNATKTLSSGLTDVNVVKMDGIAISVNGFTTTIPHPEIGGNGDIQIEFLATKEIRIKTNSDYSAFTGYVTLLYTKTADIAGSGSYNTLGVPMVHYSMNEQVIGTYLGETLYQKTFDLGSTMVFAAGDWRTVIPHNNEYALVMNCKLLNTNGIQYMTDIACNHSTHIEIFCTHQLQGRYLTFDYTKSS